MHNLNKIKLFRTLLYLTYPISLLFILPLAMLKKKSNGRVMFFFDRYAIGGAQIVHLDILRALADEPKHVFFTRFSPNNKLKETFYNVPDTTNKDIHFWCDNLLLRLFSVHYFSFFVNRHKNIHVFSSNSTFFYDMLPFLRKDIIKTELLHNFTHGNNGMEFFGLANHKYLDYRITVDEATRQSIIQQYKEYDVPASYSKRTKLIEPGVKILPELSKDHNTPLKVLYAGRGGAQKRIYLMNKVAEYFIAVKAGVEFHFAGSMMDELSETVKNHSVLHGEINGWQEMYKIYAQCHIIFLTSAYEGFPMIIKEGMANGCIPVVTALEGIKTHLKHNQNALLIETPENEKLVVEQGITLIKTLSENENLRKKLSHTAYKYAVNNFSIEVFTKKYRDFFDHARPAT